MRLAQLFGPDLAETLALDPEALREALEDVHPEDVAEILEELPEDAAAKVLRALPPDFAAEVVERLRSELQVEILSVLEHAETVALLSEMSADDRVDVLQQLPEPAAAELLKHFEEYEPEVAEEIRELAIFEEDTAGGLMTTECVKLAPDMKVWKAIEEVRRLSHEEEVETVYYIYVVAYGDKLVGVLSLRDLILSEPSQVLEDVMTENVVRILATDDQEKVATLIAKYDFSVLPVVDDNGVMLGVVTIDDVVDVVIEEATEDAQMMGGVLPLEDSYLGTGFFTFIRKRAIWLIVLFFGQLLTATVMERHQASLTHMMSLVLFIPLIISAGGNSGSQSSSLIIRAIAVGELAPRDWLRIMGRELGMGISLGLILGVVGFLRALFVDEPDHRIPLALAVSTSIVAVVTLGTLSGSLLPLAIKRIGLDPAVSSTPFIASLVDVLGLMIYFALAGAILHVAV